MGIMEKFRDDLSARLEHVESETEARQVIESVLSKIEEDDEVTGALWQTNLRANMAGQIFVRDVELKKAKVELADKAPQPTFLGLDFPEAIAQFLERDIMTPEEFAALSDTERFRSFTMSRAMSQALMEHAYDKLAQAMQGEGGLREFIQDVQGGKLGMGLDRRYLETVYRTSTATSYNAGRLRQQTDPDVATDDVVWRYVTAGDSRVRDSHAELEGKEWPVGDSEALSVYPPNGYNCRCSMIVVDREDSDPRQMARDVDTGDAVEPGFRGPPTETIEREGA